MATSTTLPLGVYATEDAQLEIPPPVNGPTIREAMLTYFVMNPTLFFTTAFFVMQFEDCDRGYVRRTLEYLIDTKCVEKICRGDGQILYRSKLTPNSFKLGGN